MATHSTAGATRRFPMIFVDGDFSAASCRSGGIHQNLSAIDDAVVNLPANPAAGMTLTIAATADSRFVTIAPDASDAILLSGKGAGDTLRVDVSGANVELVSNGSNGWVVTSMGGIWT